MEEQHQLSIKQDYKLYFFLYFTTEYRKKGHIFSSLTPDSDSDLNLLATPTAGFQCSRLIFTPDPTRTPHLY